MSNSNKKSKQNETLSNSLDETNYLKNKVINKFIKSKWYPLVFQIPTALVFVFIVYELLAGPTSPHDNFGTSMTWILWWPLIPIVFIFLGRFWCTICPFGTLNDLIQKFVGNNKPVPKFLKKYGIWIIDATFILITWSDHVFGVVESPRGSGVLLLMLTVGVVLSGALWERRTWCRYLCFLGGLSGNYSRAGMLELKGTPEKCSKCKVAACYNGNEKAAGCPMFEFPRTMESVANCNLCGNCVKSCPNDSIKISPRIPTQGLWLIGRAKLEEAFLAAVIMGIVFVQNITMIDIWDSILSKLEVLIGTDNYFATFTVTFIIAVIIPIAMLGVTSYIAGNFKKESILKNFARFGYSIIPLDVAGHIAHNLFHLLAEGKSVFYTALGLFGMAPENPSMAIVDNATIQALQYILIGFGSIGSIYTAYRLTKSNPDAKNNTMRTFIPFAILMIVFGIINIYLFSRPMAMRM